MCGEGCNDRAKMNQHKLIRNKRTPWVLQLKRQKVIRSGDTKG